MQCASHVYLALKAKELWGPPRALTGMATPHHGDRILVFRPRWLNLILDEEKDLEIRGRNLSSGPYWLGCHGTIYGHCALGSSILIDSSEAWRGLRHRHRVEVDELPYKTTYGFPVHQCRRVTLTPYEHPRGAICIVRFQRATMRQQRAPRRESPQAHPWHQPQPQASLQRSLPPQASWPRQTKRARSGSRGGSTSAPGLSSSR